MNVIKIKKPAARAARNWGTAKLVISRAMTWHRRGDGSLLWCLKTSYNLHVIHEFELYKDK